MSKFCINFILILSSFTSKHIFTMALMFKFFCMPLQTLTFLYCSLTFITKSFLSPLCAFSLVKVANLLLCIFLCALHLTFSSHKKSGSSSEESDGDVNPWHSVPTFSRTQSEPPRSHSHSPEGLSLPSFTSTHRSLSQPYMP